MKSTLHPLPKGAVKLSPGLFQHRFSLNRQYIMSLKTENLLQNFYLEAGLWNPRHHVDDIHGGWEAPTCQLRGHLTPPSTTNSLPFGALRPHTAPGTIRLCVPTMG